MSERAKNEGPSPHISGAKQVSAAALSCEICGTESACREDACVGEKWLGCWRDARSVNITLSNVKGREERWR